MFDNSLWRESASDLAFRDPFSENTGKARKKVLIVSSLLFLNSFFPLDLAQSHVLGVHFKEGSAPPLSGVLAILLLYFLIVLAVYSYQELKAWLAQAKSIDFAGARKNLHNIFAHHESIAHAIEGAATQMVNHREAVEKLTSALNASSGENAAAIESNLNSMEVHKESFQNMCNNLNESNSNFGEEIASAKEAYRRAHTDYRSAMLLQGARVGIIDIVVPFGLAGLALYLSSSGMVALLGNLVA